MTRIVEWDGEVSSDFRLTKFEGTGDGTWTETRRNLFVPSQIGQLFATNSAEEPKTFDTNSVYRSFHFPVEEGRKYSVRRQEPFTNRFQIVFSAEEPASGVEWLGEKITNNSAEVLNGIEVPEGAGWMHIYLSSTSQEVPGLLVEKADVAGAVFDGDTDPEGETNRTLWVGEPGEPESVLESHLAGTTITLSRSPAPEVLALTAYHLREDGVSLFGKGEDSVTIPASTIKMLTSYIARQYVTDQMLSEVMTVEADDVANGSTFEAGDVVSWNTLFHAMLMVSDNGAAHVIARNVGSLINSEEGWTGTDHTAFRNKANDFMAERGWRGAVFQSASGQDSVGRVSPKQLCELMFLLDSYVLNTSMLLSYEASVTGPNARSWTITHGLSARFPDFPDLVGVKTGALPSEETAGVVMLNEIGGVRHATAVLGEWPSDNRWVDSRTIIDFIGA